MILPLPVVPGSGEEAVKFLNLEKEPDLFTRLEELYPVTQAKMPVLPAPLESYSRNPKPLPVVKVGAFEASFVPTRADFSRLDERFRLKEKVWQKLPQYATWGFAVFKLRQEATTVHPMAFSFPNANPQQGLFFPTVHIHDGKVHAEEEFNHTLYCQTPSGKHGPRAWEESEKLPVSLGALHDDGLLDRHDHVYRRTLQGMLPNLDTYA